ncbi:MAG: tRNA pseudouridine(55) synthase TruB [Clostridiaceae bacterium]|nr:tRNA pseudouridine(55) synthase TruB [Clostridiaceae bacterium]
MTTGIVTVDKPSGMTSHTVVDRMRRIFGQKSVGHGGTLDPMATGVLPIFLGRATRASAYALEGDKTYAARLRFGISTDTQDITGTTLRTCDSVPSREAVLAVLPRFTGVISQVPPMYSAVQKDGKRLYELARRGMTVEREARTITIYEISLYEGRLPEESRSPFGDAGDGELDILVTCSKGTYIRTLAADIGDALGCGAALAALRRMKTGVFTLEDAYTLEQLEDMKENGSLGDAVRPCDRLFADLPCLTLDAEGEERIRRGAPVYLMEPAGRYRLYGRTGEFLGLGAVRETDRRPELMIEKGMME